VDSGSLIYADRNAYSSAKRLIGEQVEARLYLDHVEFVMARKRLSRCRACADGGNIVLITATLSTG